jgi:hypothetical protein
MLIAPFCSVALVFERQSLQQSLRLSSVALCCGLFFMRETGDLLDWQLYAVSDVTPCQSLIIRGTEHCVLLVLQTISGRHRMH